MAYRVKSTGRWAAQGRDENRKRVALGTYATRAEALAAEAAGYTGPRDPFWDRVEKTDGCWLWTGAANSEGYGRLRDSYAHRFSYETNVGAIPDGHDVHHACENRLCVNPDHLEVHEHGSHKLLHAILNRRRMDAEVARAALVTRVGMLPLTRLTAQADMVMVGV